MAQESGSQNKNSGFSDFLLRNQVSVIVVALVIVGAGYYFLTRSNDLEETPNQDSTEQTGNQNESSNGSTVNENQNGGSQPSGNGQGNGQAGNTGNVTATGTLLTSDMPIRGNYMVDGPRGKIYVSTKRDFTSLLNKEVTLNAQGTLNSFTFLGFNGQVAGTDTTAVGGGDSAPEATNVSFNGTLRVSENFAKGNYVIAKGDTKVYLKSKRNYDKWVGQEVTLSATGTLNDFTNATLSK